MIELKNFFDEQLRLTVASIGQSDSDRLVKNKVNGFLIGLQDKLLEIKPSLMRQGYGAGGPEEEMSYK